MVFNTTFNNTCISVISWRLCKGLLSLRKGRGQEINTYEHSTVIIYQKLYFNMTINKIKLQCIQICIHCFCTTEIEDNRINFNQIQ